MEIYMDQKPRLSVLLSFQNQRDEVESSLTAFFELETIPFELIIIDDASTDGTGQAIQSLLDYYQHDHTFFFEHTAPAGRGNCLNEALQQANTSIIWAPSSVQEIDEDKLADAISSLRNADVPCLTQTFSIPGNIKQWVDFIQTGDFPHDGQFLWNLNAISSTKQFFNPYLSQCHGIDWMMRLGVDTLQFDDSFFSVTEFEQAPAPDTADRQELILSLLRRPGMQANERQLLINLLLDLPAISETKTTMEHGHDLLEKAVALKKDGQLSAALECIEEVLESEPGNSDAKQLKIKILERKRRFVEASELKHELQSDARMIHPGLDTTDVKTSIIIPTALYGKPALEHCLVSVGEFCNPANTELIIIDNASLDDTHDYLQEIKEKNFFNNTIITNKQNRGFAASVNQGLKAAAGQYACIIHNDMEFTSPAITMMEQLMDEHPEYALAGPLADSTLNPDQLAKNADMYDSAIAQTDYLDSFCMMVRTDAGITMDEEYTLAFFDDIDFSFQIRKAGHKVGIIPGVQVNHHYGTTTFALDLDTESELYWKNIAYFNEKWGVETYSEEELKSLGRFDQLLALDELVNPLYPEKAIQERFEELFTDEMRTEIMKSNYDAETLQHLVHLTMVMEKRDIMRRLEDRLDDAELPAGLIYEFVRFYFDRNIYSRCLHYLNKLTSQQESLQSELYRLAILIDEKKIEDAIPKLTELLDKAPSNPHLYKLAGDIHSFENNNEEAESFYALAHQINPFDFSENEKEFYLK